MIMSDSGIFNLNSHQNY